MRGLDYYTKTVFEVWAEGIGAQSAVCGGGRYDGLMELLDGPPTPAVGFAAGLERAVLVMQHQQVEPPALPIPPVYVAYLDKRTRSRAVQLLVRIREAGIGAQIAMSGSLRSQLRHADKRGARFVLILGEDELDRGEVTVKDLGSEGAQQAVPLAEIVPWLEARLEEA